MTVIFYITGKENCEQCAHALHVAQILEQCLPNVRYKFQEKPQKDWQAYLETINTEKGWHCTKSPLIWKEITRMGSKPYLIGSLSEFWEYCFDYYGFQSQLCKSDRLKIIAENAFINSKQEEKIVFKHMSVIGAAQPITDFIILELQNFIKVGDNMETIITLYDEAMDDPDLQESFLETVEELKPLLKCEPKHIKIVTNLSDAVKDCDILFIISNYAKIEDETVHDWLHRCMLKMLFLSEEINANAKRTLRVILSHEGPVCFNASILMENCTTIRLANIVAVTADEGISTLDLVAQKSELPLEQMGCPPVWGFTGYNSPFLRTTKVKETSVLPKGQVKCELRLLSYIIEDEKSYQREIRKRKKKEVSLLNRPPMLAKVRAIASLLKLWCSDQRTDDIISLGVCSNGSFGFPSGVVLSQPVMLNEKYIWEPFSNFPVPEKTKDRLEDMLLEISDVLDKFGIGQRSVNGT